MVARLAMALKTVGVDPLWDNQLQPGIGFSMQIQKFISNSHILLPVITAASVERPWVHQEIGFAKALGKPILPVTFGSTPLGLISDIQAVELREDLTDLSIKLSADTFQRVIDEAVEDRPATYKSTPNNTRRAELLAHYANSVSLLRKFGMVRQIVSLSTFHLPNRDPNDAIWKRYFAATPNDYSLFEALRQERVALQKHAVECGCRLVLDPVDRLVSVYERHGLDSVHARVKGLLTFLKDNSISNITVAINDDQNRKGSLTLVGDWFSSEAVSSGTTRVLREALFTRHGPTVQQQVEDFDIRMQDLLANRGWSTTRSRTRAIAYFQEYLTKS